MPRNVGSATNAIEGAFSNTLYPGDRVVFQKFVYKSNNWMDSKSVRCFMGKKWNEVDRHIVHRSHPLELSFVGSLYFLPSILLSILEVALDGDHSDFVSAYIYDDLWNNTKEFNRTRRKLKECLSGAQRLAVIEFLKARLGVDDEAVVSLRGSWSSFLPNRGHLDFRDN